MTPSTPEKTKEETLKVVSRFEYAIMQAAKIEDIDKYRPITVEEESVHRKEKADIFMRSIKIKK